MNVDFNEWVGTGKLGKDPEIRHTNSGSAICTFSIAIGFQFKKQDKWVDGVDWINIVCFGKQAEAHAKYLSKGSSVGITGKLTHQTWKDGEGKKHSKHVVTAHKVKYLGDVNKSREDTSGENTGEDKLDDMPF
ncbi:MAG: single-stranded DNA-binding protein [Nitrospira sp.]